MKFKITDKQAKKMKQCISVHQAATQTLREALAYHSNVMQSNQDNQDKLWDEIALEHDLDMVNIDWMFIEAEGVPYVISQSRQTEDKKQN
jgi:hypothetical protein